jgi:hypothetical protein
MLFFDFYYSNLPVYFCQYSGGFPAKINQKPSECPSENYFIRTAFVFVTSPVPAIESVMG